MLHESLEALLTDIDTLIRAGKAAEAKAKLVKAKNITFPRDLRLRFARFARRLGMPELTVRLLSPIVRPKGRKVIDATTEEKADYAAALVKIGAPQEALQILKALNPKEMPEILLYEAFAYISIWDYQQAIPVLYEYINTPTLTDYQKEIGRTNLGAALVHESDPRAKEVLETLITHSRTQKYPILEGNGLLSLGELYFNNKDYIQAEKALQEAEKIFTSPDSLETLFISKWRALIQLSQTNANELSVKALEEIRKQASAKRHWETLRDCDHYQATFSKNTELFLRLYFGTPFDSFKITLIEEFGQNISIPNYFYWSQRESKAATLKSIDLLIEETDKKTAALKERQGNHRLLLILASDFYRPHRMAALHYHLYPEEYFNTISSPLRVRKAISRLRQWVEAKNLPLLIEEEEGSYRLLPKFGHALGVPLVKKLERGMEALTIELKDIFHESPFSAREASESLKMNQWTTILMLKKAREEGLVIKTGKGNKVKYLIHSYEMPLKKSA